MTALEYVLFLRRLDDCELAHETGVALTGKAFKGKTRGDYAAMVDLCQAECARRDRPTIFADAVAKVSGRPLQYCQGGETC